MSSGSSQQLRPLATVAFAGALLLCGGAQAAEPNYTSKAPYAPRQALSSYHRPPSGFSPVFTQHVARHGSRGLSSRKYDDLTVQILEAADQAGALTPLGRELETQAKALMSANVVIGYGNLTPRGVREHREMGGRVQARLPSLFAGLAAQDARIEIVSSGEPRAAESGRHFAEGLVAADGALAPLVDAPRVDRDQLYFHKAKANADYQAYADEDPQLKAAMRQVAELPRTRTVARHMLERFFTPAFVRRLAAGELRFVDRGDGDTVVASDVEAALAIYNLLLIAPGMDRPDARPDRFLTRADADWLAYLTDAEDFYEKGPGFAGRDVTYRMADVLLEDFFAQVEGRMAGTNPRGAVFRFAHAEEIIPLAARMRLPGSTRPAPAGELYTYANNPWRGAEVSPMAANVQWDLFRKGDSYIVRMLYNEKEIPFKAGCRPIAPASLFYAVGELQRCFGRTPTPPTSAGTSR
ncbi:MAG: histidine-type phosphatase [Phenylobacterium zucineum]|nr:MAG: histidine-type phosphatase [Phenylobacterium zucineum]